MAEKRSKNKEFFVQLRYRVHCHHRHRNKYNKEKNFDQKKRKKIFQFLFWEQTSK